MIDITIRLESATLDKDNFPRMDSERQVPVGLAKEAKAEIERLRAALENAEQFVDLYINGSSSIADGMHTLAHIREALNQQKTDDTPQAFIDAKKERDDGWPDR